MGSITSTAFVVWYKHIASVLQSTGLSRRYTYLVSTQPEQGFQQRWNTTYVIFSDKFTTVQQVSDVQTCESSPSLRHAGRLSFCTALGSPGHPGHLNPAVFAPWAWASAEWGRTILMKMYQFWSSGHLSSWDQTLDNYTSIVSHIYLASGTVKVDTQQPWQGIDKDGNSPRQQTKYGSKWNNKSA